MNRLFDFLKLRDPQQASPLQRAARQLYLFLAMVFAAGIVLMVFVAGIGALVDASHFAAHRGLSYPMMGLPLLMLVLGLIGGIGLVPLFLTGITLLILTFQFPFIYAFDGTGRALHVANAMLLFWLALVLLQTGKRLVNEMRSTPVSALGASLPGVGVFLLSLLFVGVYAFMFPAGQAAAELDAAASGAEVFAATCASCHGPEGEGAFGPALAGNPVLADEAYVREVIMEGEGAMPPQQLTAEQLNRVVGFLQESWGPGSAAD